MDLTWLENQFPYLSSIAPLAKGGQKFVFSAIHPDEGNVVLKLILGSDNIERVPREKLAVQRVNSPRVPRIIDTGTGSTPLAPCVWILEQCILGENLREILNKGIFHVDDLVRLGIQMLEALVDAEKEKVVHRDIKPENIIMDQSGSFWLLDFGLARLLDLESLTPTGNPFGVGTLGYCAPEQLRNRKKDIDSRTDLFSIGIVLYECATGVNPFRDGARDPLEIADRTENQPLPPLRLSCDSKGELQDFIAALTQKFQDQRPRNAAEALDWMKEIEDSLK